MSRSSRVSADVAKIEALHSKWILHYGQEGAAWLMVMLKELNEKTSMSTDQAIFAVDSWARTSVLLYEEVGFERLAEYQQLAMASRNPHLELRHLYLAVVSGG